MWEVLESIAILVGASAAFGVGLCLGYLAGRHTPNQVPPDPGADVPPDTKWGLVSESDYHRLDKIFGTIQEPPDSFELAAPRHGLTKCGGVGKWIVVYENVTNNAWVVCDLHVKPFLEGKRIGRNFRFLAIREADRRAGTCEGAPIIE